MSETVIRDIDPGVCDHIINSLKPVIEHLQHLIDQFTSMPEFPQEYERPGMDTIFHPTRCPVCNNGVLKLKLTKSKLYNRYECTCGTKLLVPKKGSK